MEPFVVRHYTGDEGPNIKGNGFDGLRVGEDREEAERFVRWVNAAIGFGLPKNGKPAPAPYKGWEPGAADCKCVVIVNEYCTRCGKYHQD